MEMKDKDQVPNTAGSESNKADSMAELAYAQKSVSVKAPQPIGKLEHVFLLTRPQVEGEWKPTVELVEAGDPRAIVGPDSMVLPQPSKFN